MEAFTGLLWSVIGFAAGYVAGRDLRRTTRGNDHDHRSNQ